MNSWETELYSCLQLKNESGAISIFKQGFPVNYQLKSGLHRGSLTYPMNLAIDLGLPKLLVWLLQNKGSLELRDSSGRTPFLSSAVQGDLSILETLCKYSFDCTVRDFNGNSALHLAVQHGHYGVAKFLLERLHLPASLLNGKGQTALGLAQTLQQRTSGLKAYAQFQRIVELLWKETKPARFRDIFRVTDFNRTGVRSIGAYLRNKQLGAMTLQGTRLHKNPLSGRLNYTK